MPRPAVQSCFDVAFWFLDRALDDGEYLQPQKMHRLLFLAQAYYASAKNGAKLMPASFVIGAEGPIEPNVFRAMERGRPMVDTSPIDEEVSHVLDSVWRQFGAKSTERLNAALNSHPPIEKAKTDGQGAEILFEDLVDFYMTALSDNLARRDGNDREKISDAPSIDKVLRPKLMRSHTGKPVSVNRWSPRKVTK